MNDNPVTHEKALLRERMLARRAEISPQERADAATAVAGEFQKLMTLKSGVILSGFFSVGFEFDCMPLMLSASEAGVTLALPRIMPKRILMFLPWKPGDAMTEGALGIPFPSAGNEIYPDIVITPLLAFDDEGRRLGYGGGYYDRAIERLRAIKPIVTIGVAQAWQKLDALPVEDHDHQARLDFVITELGPVHCRTSH
ncbi:MAG: 5-formyltetrahydrofolate cyclo-ligase [Chitinophagales bacterium]|nr:5-formyltetrahydrofolate cyclo-ligase [Hyphomicrobiales bacterium]